MKLTSVLEGGPRQELAAGEGGETRFVRLIPADGRAVDGDAEGPMPVVDVWFLDDGTLVGRICWASAAPGNTDRFRDFEDPEQYAPDHKDEK